MLISFQTEATWNGLHYLWLNVWLIKTVFDNKHRYDAYTEVKILYMQI